MSVFTQTQQDIERSINILPGSKFWEIFVYKNMRPLYNTYRRSNIQCFTIENNRFICLIPEGTMSFDKKSHSDILQYIPGITSIECQECIAFNRYHTINGDCGIRDLYARYLQFINVVYISDLNLHGHVYLDNVKRVENVGFDCHEIVTSIRFPEFRNCDIPNGTHIHMRCYDLGRNTRKDALFYERLGRDLWAKYDDVMIPDLKKQTTTTANRFYIPYTGAPTLNLNKMFGLSNNISELDLEFAIGGSGSISQIIIHMKFTPVKDDERQLFKNQLTQDGFVVNYYCVISH